MMDAVAEHEPHVGNGRAHEHPMTLAEHRRLAQRLRRFWGRVAARQDDWLAQSISGSSVLEIGCGYGALVGRLRSRGLTACGVDADAASLRAGCDVLGPLPVVSGDAYRLPFFDHAFDTVVFRDSLHHLEPERALAEAERLSRCCVVVFEPNMMPLLRLARRLVGHAEHETLPLERTVVLLTRRGWRIERVRFRDVVALPLSGGYIGPELVPPIRIIGTLLLTMDEWLTRAVHALGLSPWLCWRYAVVAWREPPVPTPQGRAP